MIFCRMLPVCSAEKTSVEKKARTHSHSSVGSQARSLLGREAGTGSGNAVAVKLACLFESIIRRFTCDDHVMHVALTQARAADADETRFLLQLKDAVRAAIAHTGAQTTDELVDHLRQRASIRHTPFDSFRHQLAHAISGAVAIAHGHTVRGGIV